jgi:hypothetical protein
MVVIAATAAFSAATMARVPAGTSTSRLWSSDFANYPANPSARGSHAARTYEDYPRDRARLLVAMELIVDSAAVTSDAKPTTDHVTRIAERLATLGATKTAVAALDRAMRQNDDIMRNYKADHARGVIRVDPRWTANRDGYPHVQNCNYLRSKGLCLMMGSGNKPEGNEEFPTAADQRAAKELAMETFAKAVATCKDMRRTSRTELYPTSTDRETVGVLMLAAKVSRELGWVADARGYLDDCVRTSRESLYLRVGGDEQRACESLLATL